MYWADVGMCDLCIAIKLMTDVEQSFYLQMCAYALMAGVCMCCVYVC